MERKRILPAIIALALLSAPAVSQSGQPLPAPQPSPATVPAQRPMPFPTGGDAGSAYSIAFLSAGQMSQTDRDLAAASQPAIRERAAAEDFDFKLGDWAQEQLACDALPNHLFLRFTRDSGKGDISIFSASIPRNGSAHVRIIPILRRGYSLFSPAPVNALTIAAFNRILEEEGARKNAGWLATGLCYAALAGAHPLTGAPEQLAAQILPAATPPVLEIPVEGGAVISFTDTNARPRPMDWTMTFDGKGKLLAATHTAHPKSSDKVVTVAPGEVQDNSVRPSSSGKRVAVTPKEVEGKVVPQPSAAPNAKIVSPDTQLKPGKVILIKPTEVQGKPVPQQ